MSLALAQFVVNLLPKVTDELLAPLLAGDNALARDDRLPLQQLLSGRRLIKGDEIVDLIDAEVACVDVG